MSTHFTRNKVNIFGHKNPDTDSICSAIAYTWLKQQTDKDHVFEARRCGHVNRESKFALNYWQADTPRLCTSVSPQMKDVDFRLQPGIDSETTIRSAWIMMREQDIETLCIIDKEKNLKGLITMADIANANMAIFDTEILAEAHTSYQSLMDSLDGELIIGNIDGIIEKGRIFIGTSPEVIEENVEEGDIVLVTNRYESQICALECGASVVIICAGSTASKSILKRAEEKKCVIMSTPYDTYVAARMVSTAVPVRHIMLSENLLVFGVNTYVEDARKVMASVRHRYFPILDMDGKYLGVCSRRNLLNVHPKPVILVDHNELDQSDDGMDEAEILEIIDHHRIGNIETNGPAYFRAEPVGCTSTIIWTIMREKELTPPKQIAGLMLSAILSDTLCFRSPTCTARDVNAAEALAKIAEVDINEYAKRMFEAGEDLTGRSGLDILYTDFKIFTYGDLKFGVGQSTFMTEKNRKMAEELVKPVLEQALAKSGIEMVFYMATDTPSKTTDLYCAGENADMIARFAFKTEPQEDGAYILHDVVSRKKQMIPPLRMAMQAQL